MRPRTTTQHITAATASDAKAWAKHLGCSVAELRIAMRAVGNSTEGVRAYLAALGGAAPEAVGSISQLPISNEERPAAPFANPPTWPPAG